MKNGLLIKSSFSALLFLPLFSFSQNIVATGTSSMEGGVSRALAVYRKATISKLSYNIKFSIPDNKNISIPASEILSFYWKKNNHSLPIDFKEQPDHVQQIMVNDKKIPVVFKKEHLFIPAQDLKEGINKVAIQFTAGDLSLNRNEDYLYTLLVPDRARTVFPCFDQPDLKATFQLTLSIAKNWQAVANAPVQDSIINSNSKTYHYQPSDTISTYLFSFAAGRFERVTKEENNRTMSFLHRETDTSKIRLSMDTIFRIQADALAFMKDYTQIPFPFKKFDFVAIPDFQYGGMEHVGAILYKASSLFLDSGATQDQKIARANVLAHETAHMWFGDMVTMRWFNDVWMKEVFANFMADKISQLSLADNKYDLKFLVDHFPAAYSIDRTAGANPIRQPLNNLQDAGSLYGNIIYHKAPVMMQQLEKLMGKDPFRDGLREYLKKYAYSNASWPDLIKILDAHTSADLQKWNEVWVNSPGRPQFEYLLKSANNKISSFIISQKAEDNSGRIWPQFFKVAFLYPTHTEEFNIDMTQPKTMVKAATGKAVPSCILFNASGEGYGLFPIDTTLLSKVSGLKDRVMRAAAYINLYENMLSGRVISPQQLLNTYRHILADETEELNVRLICGQLSNLFWQFTAPPNRVALAPTLEKELWQAMLQETSRNKKKILFKTYQSIALSKAAVDTLYTIWQKQQPPAGVVLTEDDYTSLALALAVRDYKNNEILNQQLLRIQNPDRKKRLQYMMPALSSDVHTRDAFFASLKDEKNRQKEAWVTAALDYLHNPLRAATSQKYLKESLELLQEIQLTGDIFFPQSWLGATFGSYQSAEAAAVVRNFLKAHPAYNPKLKAKILQSADMLFRAEKLVHHP